MQRYAGRYLCLQWMMFQMGGRGPAFGYTTISDQAVKRFLTIERYATR
jgi:hypothetical protein